MPYRIAGIDVHKRMLAVVVADVAVAPEYVFERRVVGTTPDQLRALATWFVEREVDEVVMESTAQCIGARCGRSWNKCGTRRDAPARQRGRRRAPFISRKRSRIRGRAVGSEIFPTRAAGEALGGGRAHPELCAGCDTASVADGHAAKCPIDEQSCSVAEPPGVPPRRGAHQGIEPSFGSAGTQYPPHAPRHRDGRHRPARRRCARQCALARDARSITRRARRLHRPPVYRRLLAMTLDELDVIEAHLKDLAEELARLLRAHQDVVQRLAAVPGLGVDSAQQIIAEVGPTAATFATAKRLASWMGACPGDEESAGINHSHRSPKGNRQMRRLLNQAAQAAVKTKGSIFELVYRRLVVRLGHAQAIGAVAHRLCRLVWKILHEGVAYEERGPAVTRQRAQRRAAKMIRELRSLGYRIELLAPAASPA